jgi:hypothetical protein
MCHPDIIFIIANEIKMTRITLLLNYDFYLNNPNVTEIDRDFMTTLYKRDTLQKMKIHYKVKVLQLFA